MESSVKICLLTLYPPTKHGIANYAWRLTQALSLQLPKNYKIVVLADRCPHSNDESYHIRKVEVRRIWRKGLLSCFTMLNAVLREKPHVVHTQFTYTYIWGRMSFSVLFPFTLLLLKTLRRPILVTIHDIIDLSSLNEETMKLYETKFPPAIARLGILTVTKLIALFSNKILVHSVVSQETLIEDYRINAVKVVVIKHGTPPLDPDCCSSAEAKRALNLQGKHVALFFGFLAPNKGIEWLLQSFAHVASKNNDAVLLIAGGNHPRLNYNYMSKLVKLTQRLGLENKVVFLGYVIDDMVPLLFKAADVVVLPYLIGVSTSGVLKMAISHLKPIITSNIPTFREELIHNVTGVLVKLKSVSELSEALQKLLSNDGLRNELSNGIREMAKQQSWHSVSKDTLNLYINAISGSKR